MLSKGLFTVTIPVADPRFSRGGCANFQIGIILSNFLPKTAWKWKNLHPGGARVPGAPPLDPPIDPD